MKLIGLDVGTVRIGVARADSKVKIAIPAGMVPVDGNEFEQIARLGRVYNSQTFVLGLPRNNEGEETKQSDYVRDFAETLKAKIPGAKVYFQDETLTSVTAEERLKNSKKSPKAKRASGDIDAEAAVIILQDFLEHFAKENGERLPKEAAKQTSHAIKKQKRSRKYRGLKIAMLILGITVLLAAALVGGATIFYNLALQPVYAEDTCEACPPGADCICQDLIKFQVKDGASTAEIAADLEASGLIKNAFAFRVFTKLNHHDGAYKAGTYEISNRLSLPEIADLLIKGTSTAEVFRFTILPGETIATIKNKLEKIGYERTAIDAAFAKSYDHPVLADKPAGQGLEGYIYGETYEFYVGETVENIIIRTLNELYRVVQKEDLINAYAEKGLTLYQGITLASVVQKESRTDDMPTVAQVFLTRLSKGIMLGSDVTTKYALDQVDPDRTTYKNNSAALKVPECHNTRLYAGLPCGPIASPGKAALLAVAHPSDTSYLYFLTGDDSMMYYSYTEKEHQQNIRSHCQQLCKTAL